MFDGIYQAGYHAADALRNQYAVFGYPQSILFSSYFNMYLRGGVANACICKPVEKRWQSSPDIYDEEWEEDGKIIKREKTGFEKAVQRLVDEFDLWGVLKELDECQRIGLYGGVLITAREGTSVSSENLATTKLQVANYVDGLINLSPCFESQLDLSDGNRDDNMQSKRYGLPLSYRYREGSEIQGSKFGNTVSVDQEIHWSRAFVFSEFAHGNGIIGRPALMPVFNSLIDWYKTVGSAAEGHFKNSKQRTNLDVKDQQLAAQLFQSQPNAAQNDFNDELEEYDKGFNNYLRTAGIEAKVLQAAIADPTGPAGIALQDICAGIGIPKTELIGFETGERSSSENANSWNVKNQSWRETTGTKLVTRFLMHLVDVGVLPAPKNNRIFVDWPDISAASIEQRIKNASDLAPLLRELNAASKTLAVDSIVNNLLPDVLNIDIEQEPNDLPGDGLDDAED